MRLLLELVALALFFIVGLTVGSTYFQSDSVLYRMYEIQCTEYVDDIPRAGWHGVGLGFTRTREHVTFWRADTGNRLRLPRATSDCEAKYLHQKSTLPPTKH